MPPTRLAWIDSARGAAIVLLLIWHCTAIPWTQGIPIPGPLWAFTGFFMPFRMPTLMFLSGLMLSRSLAKQLPRYYAGKLSALAWPFVVWVAIAGALGFARPGWPSDPRSWGPEGTYLWFLFYLGCYFALGPVLRLLPPSIWIAAALFGSAVLPHGEHVQRFCYFAVFFLLGDRLASPRGDITRLVPRAAAVACAVAAVGFGLLTARNPIDVQFDTWSIPFSLAGILALLSFPHTGRVADLCAWAGRSSIVYYLVHFPLMVVLTRALKDDVSAWTLAAINLGAALAVCTALAAAKNVVPVAWLFRAPRTLTVAVERLLTFALPGQESNLRRLS